MSVTPVLAQAAPSGAPTGGPQDLLIQLALPAMLLVIFYFLMIRPQQQRAKQQQQKLGGIKRGDTVVLSSGVIAQVTRVEDSEITAEIAKGVEIKVVKAMVADVRTRGAPVAANDKK